MIKLLKVSTAMLVFWGMALVVWPMSATAALANVSHAYHAEGDNISNGDLVSLSSSRSDYVELANTSNGSRLTGVAVNPRQSLLAVNPSAGLVQVATTGNTNVLVSTINGNLAVGDQVSVSPLSGIGMKANPGLQVIGLATTSLNQHSAGVTKEEIRNKQGKLATIWLGYISLNINISTDNNTSTGINSLQKIVENLTGHVVPTYRIIISVIIAAITMFSVMAVAYSAIYGSIISIGRNPLAKHEIQKTLRSVILMTLLITVVACFTIYLLIN